MITYQLLHYRVDLVLFLILSCASVFVVRYLIGEKAKDDGFFARFLIVITLILLSGGILAEYSARREFARLQQSVRGFATNYANSLRQIGHAQITANTPSDDWRYRTLIGTMDGWKKGNPDVADIYTFRLHPDGSSTFVIHSEFASKGESDGVSQEWSPSRIGKPFHWLDEYCLRAADGEEVFTPLEVDSERGVRVSSLLPMRDSRGRVEAVLGVDYRGERWVSRILGVRIMFMGIALIVIIMACCWVFIRQLRRSIARLEEAEDRLSESEKRFRSLVESVPNIAVQGYDKNRRVIFWNTASTRLYGYTSEEAMGRQLEELIIPPYMREGVIAAVNSWVAGGPAVPAGELALQGKGGSTVNVYSSHVMQVNSRGEREMYCIDIDLSERIQAEAARSQAEERYRLIFENAIEGIYQTTPEGRFLTANPAIAKVFGFGTPQELMNHCVDLAKQGYADPQGRDDFKQLIETQGSVSAFEIEIQRRDGSRVWISTNAHVVRDAQGKVVCYEGSLIDITERKRSEKALLEVQQRLQAILDQSPAIVYVKNLEGRYILTNRQFDSKFSGISGGLVGKTVHDLFQKELADELLSHDLSTVSSGQAQAMEEKSQEADGQHTYLAVKFPLRNSAGDIYAICGISTDITEKKTLESQILQVQKMDAVGQLAGGIAHDFNNVLAGFMLNVGFLVSEPGLSEGVRESLRDIQNQAKRASSLTRRLLLFSRRQIMETKKLNLIELIEDIAKMLRRVLGEEYTLVIEQLCGTLWIEADAGMIDQMVMNLCVNARDAMPRGGRIVLRLREAALELDMIAGNAKARPGRFACLEVEDAGCGMSEATMKRLFEPFFTTKEVGKGTGLGLATVYAVAQQHKGWVEVNSSEGSGSVFTVFLPVCEIPDPGNSNHPFPAVLRGAETVLVVEDEHTVRKAVRQVLERAGYRILEAETGPAALRLWDDNRGNVDLLFTDMVLPGGMSGIDLAKLLRIYKPGLKIIVSSGYNAELIADRRDKAIGAVYMAKPFSSETLVSVVRGCIDSPPQGG